MKDKIRKGRKGKMIKWRKEVEYTATYEKKGSNGNR
jgi:hypothetical protein